MLTAVRGIKHPRQRGITLHFNRHLAISTGGFRAQYQLVAIIGTLYRGGDAALLFIDRFCNLVQRGFIIFQLDFHGFAVVLGDGDGARPTVGIATKSGISTGLRLGFQLVRGG